MSAEPTKDSALVTMVVSSLFVLAFTCLLSPLVLWDAYFARLILDGYIRPIWQALPMLTVVQLALIKVFFGVLLPRRSSCAPDPKLSTAERFIIPFFGAPACWLVCMVISKVFGS